MRNKAISVISYKKYKEPKQYFHCKIHGCMSLEIPEKGLWCPLGCGPTSPAILIVQTSNIQQLFKSQAKRSDMAYNN